jgi:hypothetical protein
MHHCPCCGSELDCPRLRWLPAVGVLIGPGDEWARLPPYLIPIFEKLWDCFLKDEKIPLALRKLEHLLKITDITSVGPPGGYRINVYLCQIRNLIRHVSLDLIVYGGYAFVVSANDEQRKQKVAAFTKYAQNMKWRRM